MTLLDNVFGFPKTPMQRAYMWECLLPDVWGAGILGLAVTKYCQTIRFGDYNMDDISEMKTGAFKKFFAGDMNIGNPVASFVVPIPDIVSNYFHVWRKMEIDNEGFYHKASEYKKNIYVVLYGTVGLPVNMITLEGVFPKTAPSWNLSYESETMVKFEIEFKVDRIRTGFSAFSSFGNAAKKGIGELGSKIAGFF